MKNKHITLLLLLFFVNLSIISTQADNFVLEKEVEYDYHYTRVNSVTVKNLIFDVQYTLMVGNNTYDPKNITWVATEVYADIYYKYSGGKTDLNNDTLTQLELILIQDNTVVDTFYLNMVYIDDWLSWGQVMNIFMWIIIVTVVLSALILIARIGLNFID